MKKFILLTLLISAFIIPSHNAHALKPKAKAFAIICAYGTVGGALLGFASMAFGTDSRIIAQGASLGLYAGIAFGTYVITSHRNPNEPQVPEYQDPQLPPPGYDPGYGAPDSGGFGAPPPRDEPGGFFGSPQRMLEENDFEYSGFKRKKGRVESLPIYFNLLDVKF